MIEVPECRSKCYKVLDGMLQELSMSISSEASVCEPNGNQSNFGKLMNDFWNTIQEDPNCNLTTEAQRRLGLDLPHPSSFKPNMYKQHYITYMAGQGCNSKSYDNNKSCRITAPNESQDTQKRATGACCSTLKKPLEPMALSKVLCNLKEVATVDKKCSAKAKELMNVQNDLKKQIQVLEKRENEGVKMLKQADCMWVCMEDSYRKKVAESMERQQFLLIQLKDIETSYNKWRRNKKELEQEISNITKGKLEMVEKTKTKQIDLKVMDSEIQNLMKRIESCKKDFDNGKNSISDMKQVSESKMANLTAEMVKIQKRTAAEICVMKRKEQEGRGYVKETRVNLQNICKVLLQKKLENEDLAAEKIALLEEMELLTNTLDSCQDRCNNKEKSMADDLIAIKQEIAIFELKCQKCSICTDTGDVRVMCTDCPKCMQDRNCIIDGEHCDTDPTMDCICMSVKHRFLDNVFENMYTVLEREAKTGPGRALADSILKALKRSTNGKLPSDIRKVLQDFILTTVKGDLNLTIVGGALKTRCELDPESYKQLMNCLQSVKAKQVPKEDKGTPSKKDPCTRWGPSSECHCPKGPKDCLCTKKAPPHPNDPKPYPKDEEDVTNQKSCPFRDGKVCGPDCGEQGKQSLLTRDFGIDVVAWRPDPCSGPSCKHHKITRAAHARCINDDYPVGPSMSKKSTCTCNTYRLKSCHCNEDRRSDPRNKIVDEVLGRFTVVPPISKVTCSDEIYSITKKTSREQNVCDCDIKHVKVQVIDKGTHMDSCKDVRFEVPFKQPGNTIYNNRSASTFFTDITLSNASCQFDTLNVSSTHIFKSPEIWSKTLKIVCPNNQDQTLHQITVLKKTMSGTLVLELNEEMIELIKNKTNQNPLYMSVKQRKFGDFVINLDDEYETVCNTQKVILRASESGATFIELNKNIVDVIKKDADWTLPTVSVDISINTDSCMNNVIKKNKEDVTITPPLSKSKHLTESLNRSNTPTSKHVFIKKNNFNQLREKKCKSKTIEGLNTLLSKRKIKYKSSTNFKRRKTKFLDTVTFIPTTLHSNTPSLHQATENWFEIKVCHKNDLVLPAVLKLTESNNFINVIKKNKEDVTITPPLSKSKHLTESLNRSNIPTSTHVFIKKINFNQLREKKCKSKTIEGLNTLLSDRKIKYKSSTNFKRRKTKFLDTVTTIPTTPHSNTPSLHQATENWFEIKVCHKNDLVLPAVLKLTESNNFILIIDKEFENIYRKTLQNDVRRECLVSLKKTNSGYNIDLQSNRTKLHQNLNTLLVKLESGNIKILQQGVVLENADGNAHQKDLTSTQAFEDILEKIPLNLFTKTEIKHNFHVQKSVSDTLIYERNKVKHLINKSLFCKPSITYPKSQSGQEAIILTKETKNRLLNILTTFFGSIPKGHNNITKTDSNKIIINLNHTKKELHSLLKIGPSVNVFLTQPGSNHTNDYTVCTTVRSPNKIHIKCKSVSQYNNNTQQCCYCSNECSNIYNFLDHQDELQIKIKHQLDYPQIGRALRNSLRYLPLQLPPFLSNVCYC